MREGNLHPEPERVGDRLLVWSERAVGAAPRRAWTPRPGAALKPGEKGVVLRGNKIVLSEKSPLRRLWTTKARQKEVSVADATPDRPPRLKVGEV